jgi:hypothetical protein
MPNIQHIDFINYLLNEKILDLLTSISNLEPTLFKKEYIQPELDSILSNINKSNLDIKQLSNTFVKKNKIKENKAKVKPTKKKVEYDNEHRCQARVWGPIFINAKQRKYGEQCHKKKCNDSKYCYIHQTKLSHGDYFEKPNIMIKEHFELNSKVVKTKNPANKTT